MANEVTKDGQEKISSVLVRGLRAGLDSRRIQMFGVKTEQLNELLPKFVVSSQQILDRNIAIKDFPTRLIIRRGAIDGFLDAVDRSTFDVAMFYEGEDTAFLNLNEERTNLRGAGKKNLHKTINQQSTDALKEGLIKEEQLANAKAPQPQTFIESDISDTQDMEDLAFESLDKSNESDLALEKQDESEHQNSYLEQAAASFQYGCTSYVCTTDKSKSKQASSNASSSDEESSSSSSSTKTTKKSTRRRSSSTKGRTKSTRTRKAKASNPATDYDFDLDEEDLT